MNMSPQENSWGVFIVKWNGRQFPSRSFFPIYNHVLAKGSVVTSNRFFFHCFRIRTLIPQFQEKPPYVCTFPQKLDSSYIFAIIQEKQNQ